MIYQAKAWQSMKKQIDKLAETDEKFFEVRKMMSTIVSEEFKKRTRGEDVAEVLTDYVNSSSRHDEDFTDVITQRTHRTLQQGVFKLFMGCVDGWAEMDKKNMHDPRNEATVKQSTKIKEALKDDYLPFI